MTLIASFVSNGIPVIIGDLLLSRKGTEPKSEVSIPTIHEVNTKISNQKTFYVVGLAQKVNIIGKNICIAWAGSHIHAKEFISDLYERCSKGDLSYKEYNQILDQYPKWDLNDLSIISYFYDGKGFYRKDLNAPMFDLDGLEDVQVAGSGTPNFVQVISNCIRNGIIEGKYNSLDEVVGRTLCFTSMLFGQQVLTGEGALEGWGGAFEIAYFHKSSFSKLGNILQVIWVVKEKKDKELEISFLPQFVKSDYLGESLSVFVCDWGNKQCEERLYIVEPLYPVIQIYDTYTPKLDYTWLVNFFSYTTANNETLVFNRVDRFATNYRPVIIDAESNRYQVRFDKTYIESIIRKMQLTQPNP